MSVNENLKNAFYTSVGFAIKGKEKIEEAAKDFAEKNKLNAEEGENFVKDVMSNFDKKQSEAQDFIKEKVAAFTDKNKLSKEEAENFVKDIMAGFEKKHNETQDFIKEKVVAFTEKNKLNVEEGEKFIKDIMAGLGEKHSHAQDFVKEKVKNAVADLGLVTRKEFEDLQAKYEELKTKMDAQ